MTRFLAFVGLCLVSLTGCYLSEMYALPKLGIQSWTFGEVFSLWAILFAMRVVSVFLLVLFRAEAKK